MPDIDPVLGLNLPLISDSFSTAVLRENWQKLTTFPGIFIAATSAQLPSSWTAANQGMLVYQVDANVLWRWNGSAFVRQHARGLLDSTKRTSDLTVSSGTFTILAQQNVTVPPGTRSIRVTGSWSEVTGGVAQLALFKGSTQLALRKCLVGSGGVVTYVDKAVAPGATTYSIQVRNQASTTTVVAGVGFPVSIDVEEI